MNIRYDKNEQGFFFLSAFLHLIKNGDEKATFCEYKLFRSDIKYNMYPYCRINPPILFEMNPFNERFLVSDNGILQIFSSSLFFKCRQNIFFAKLSSQFVVDCTTTKMKNRLAIKKVLPNFE